MRRYILAILFIVISAAWLRAEEILHPAKVTYKEYLSQVLEYYPSLKKEQASVEKTIAQKALTAASKMPQFWASVKAEYGDDPVYVFGALLRQNRFSNADFALGRLNTPAPQTDYAAGVGAQWLIFDFSQTTARIKAVGLLAESQHFNVEVTRMEAIMAASEVYSRLVLTDSMLKVLGEAVEGTGKDIAMAELLSKKGLALGADFYLARITKTQLLQMYNETKAQRAALVMVFNVLRGLDPVVPVTVAEYFKDPGMIQGSAEEWVKKAASGRLDVKAIEKTIESQGFIVESERLSFMPKVMAYGNADQNVHRLGNTGGGNYLVGIKAKIDVFDPGRGPRVKAAQEEVRRMAASFQATKDQAAKDAASVYYRLQALESNTRLAVQMRDDAAQAATLMMPLYKEGRRSIEQIIAVRSAMVQAHENWLRLESTRRQSLLTLKFYAGELNPVEAEGIYGQ